MGGQAVVKFPTVGNLTTAFSVFSDYWHYDDNGQYIAFNLVHYSMIHDSPDVYTVRVNVVEPFGRYTIGEYQALNGYS